MKPTAEQIAEKYFYDDQGWLCYAIDSGRHGRYKAGTRAGSVTPQGVRTILLGDKYYQEHQLVWCLVNGSWPPAWIRHKNGDLLDNRIENLEMDYPDFKTEGAKPSVRALQEMLEYNPDTGIFKWKIRRKNIAAVGDEAGFIGDTGYVMIGINRRPYRAHRIAWAITHGEWPDSDIDHINRIKTDNRLENLRLASRSENQQNTDLRSDNKTGFKGVHLRSDTGKYSASIAIDGQSKYLGCYSSIESAKLVRSEAELKLHPFRATGAA